MNVYYLVRLELPGKTQGVSNVPALCRSHSGGRDLVCLSFGASFGPMAGDEETDTGERHSGDEKRGGWLSHNLECTSNVCLVVKP